MINLKKIKIKKIKNIIKKMIKNSVKYFVIICNNLLFISFFILLSLCLSSCSQKPASLEITKTIKQDIKNTEQKVVKIEKEYKKLVQEQPNCSVSTIIDNVEYVKSELSTLRGKIEATEAIVITETKLCQSEIKAYKNEVRYLKLIIAIMIIGIVIVGVFLFKNKIKRSII